MTDFISNTTYKATNGSLGTNIKFNSNIQKAIDAVMPLKNELSNNQFRHLVLYALLELSKNHK